MLTDHILQMLPVVAAITMAVLLVRSLLTSRKIGLPPEDTPAAPPTMGWIDDDGGLRQTTVPAGNFVPRTGSDRRPAPHLTSVSPTTADDAAAVLPVTARLLDLSGRYKSGSFAIDAIGITIGRDPYIADIVLSDFGVSSRHAWIGLVGGKPVLRDLNSTNGTFINGRIDSPVSEVALRSGDTILFASRRFRIEMERALPVRNPDQTSIHGQGANAISNPTSRSARSLPCL